VIDRKTYYNFFKISCDIPLAIGQAYRLLDDPGNLPLWLCRFDRITLRRANACSGQANHFSPIIHSTRSMLACIELVEMLRTGLSPFTFHLSPIPQPITSHLPVRHSPAPAGRRRITATLPAYRCASRISSLHSLKASILTDLR
jgi:hypothetical protein